MASQCTGLFEMIVGVLTTCHTQYVWNRRIGIFYLIEQHSMFSLNNLQVFYMCTLCDSTNINSIMKCEHTKPLSMPFSDILVNFAPIGEMHNYFTPHIIKKTLRISKSVGATKYSYLKCTVYDKLLKPRQSFRITLISSWHLWISLNWQCICT